jgi:hypothetical protein
MPGRRFSGKTSKSIDVPQTAEGLRLQAVLDEFGTALTPGITHTAPRTPEYRQRNNRTCFYASLIAARLALSSGFAPSESWVAAQAESEGLLSRYGAETFSEFYGQQTAFIGRILGLQVHFIDQRFDDERIDVLTNGLKDKGQPVIFGVKKHWLVLDGFKLAQDTPAWIGMDPGPGRRLEDTGRELSPSFVAARLVDTGLPTVVVEGLRRSRPRFQPAVYKTPRFRGA